MRNLYRHNLPHFCTNDTVPYKRRYTLQKWRTSNGTFTTKNLGDDLDFCFPEFSESRTVRVRPDIFELEKSSDPPAYNILGIDTLVKLGVVLDFHTKSITIDSLTLPMRSMQSLKDYSKLCKQMEKFAEPASTRDATKRAVRILDAEYTKADLPKVVKENCAHLTSYQRDKLIKRFIHIGRTTADEVLADRWCQWALIRNKRYTKRTNIDFKTLTFVIHLHRCAPCNGLGL